MEETVVGSSELGPLITSSSLKIISSTTILVVNQWKNDPLDHILIDGYIRQLIRLIQSNHSFNISFQLFPYDIRDIIANYYTKQYTKNHITNKIKALKDTVATKNSHEQSNKNITKKRILFFTWISLILMSFICLFIGGLEISKMNCKIFHESINGFHILGILLCTLSLMNIIQYVIMIYNFCSGKKNFICECAAYLLICLPCVCLGNIILYFIFIYGYIYSNLEDEICSNQNKFDDIMKWFIPIVISHILLHFACPLVYLLCDVVLN